MLGFTQRRPRTAPDAAPAPLSDALDAALAFPTTRALSLQPPRQLLLEHATEEAAFGRVVIDEHGLTAGARIHVLEPARALLAEWHEARRPFDIAVEPFRADIAAPAQLTTDLHALSTGRDRALAEAEAEFEADHRYTEVKDDFEKSGARFRALQLRHGNRAANMAATSWAYKVGLLVLFAAECLINFDIFLLFTNIVAVAAGGTLVMGVLLAFAADGHGLLVKQWTHRFGHHRTVADRWSSWRLLVLATFSLLVVLAAAGGSRYAVVMHQAAAAAGPNILGEDAALTFNPVRDVMLSLLWNVMAWAAGVFLSWFAHDEDPDYMAATAQSRRASRAYHRYRKPQVDRLRTIEAQFKRETEAASHAAAARSAGVETERKLLEKLEAHEAALVLAISGAVRHAVQLYHDALAHLALASPGAITLERTGGAPLTPTELRAAAIPINPAFIRSLLS